MSESKYIKLSPREDSDRTLKVDGEKFRCYSRKKMKKLYPDGKYIIVGETKRDNQKKEICRFVNGEKEYVVSKRHSHNRIIHGISGYLCVGGDRYVVILRNRILFLLLFLLLLGCLIAGGILLGSLLSGPREPGGDEPGIEVINPLPPEDENAQAIGDNEEGSKGEKATSEAGGGSVSMIYTLSADMHLDSGEISMYFKNPIESNHDVMLELCVLSDEEPVPIAQSGRIASGYGLYSMQFSAEKVALSAGTYNAIYKVSYYDPDTGERALVESVISDLVLTVTE